MNLPTDFFAEFPPVSKEQWLALIAKDLKGKPLDDLHWQLNEALRVAPFAHADDQPEPSAPLDSEPNNWALNEDILESAAAVANRQALEALAFGAESLHFQLPEHPDFNTLLNRIHPDFIGLHFSGAGLTAGPANILAAFANQAAAAGVGPEKLSGSLYYDPAAASGRLQDWRYVLDLLEYAGESMPGFRCLTLDGRTAFNGKEGAVDELVSLLQRGSGYLEQLTNRGLNVDSVAGQLQFRLHVGTSYFVEMAKLRAFKLLWLNLLKAWNARPEYPVLDVRFSPDAYTDDLYTNMIRATTMAMSAVLGGANRLTVLPYDAGREAQAQYPQAFARRIARNVQHLLKLESGFNALSDPAAGSFYIEKLTHQLAEAAWQKFKKA